MKKNTKSNRSSEKKLSRKNVAVIAIITYFLFLAVGAALIFFLPFFLNKNALLESAHTSGRYTLTRYVNSNSSDISAEYYLFTDDAAMVTTDRAWVLPGEADSLRALVPEILEKKSVYFIKMLKGTETSRLVTIAGRAVAADSGRIFVSILVRDMNDTEVIVISFASVFTLLFLISIFLILFIMKQHDDFMKLQRDLVSNVSHELKTPITSIRAMAELLYDGMYRNDNERKRYAHTILHESYRLNNLVLEMLNLSRLQSNREKFEKEKCYADGIFTPAIDRYMMMCQDMGIEMDVSGLALEALPPLYTDPAQIVRVMTIILDNAMKFAGKGGHIWMAQVPGNDHVTFCIRDDGPGISKKNINKIFERFYKADVTRNSQGSGLGLAIANEIIRGLKEKIWVESVEGEGSSFYFTVSYI